MPRPLEKLSVGILNISGTTTLNDLSLTKTTVTQGTSITSGVSSSSPAGFVYTFTTGTIATSGSATFTVSNDLVNSNSLVTSSLVHYPGTGIPIVNTNNITSGSFDVTITNADSVNDVSGSLKIGYTIF